MTHELWLEPMDAVYFGEPRSFVAGESHAATSRFPPSPWTFQGILRTHLLMSTPLRFGLREWHPAAREERERLVGTSDTLPEGWQITAPLPGRRLEVEGDTRVEPWVAAPRHLMVRSVKRGGQPAHSPRRARPVTLRASEDKGGRSLALLSDLQVGAPGLSLLSGGPGHTAALSGWVSAHNLAWALTGQGAWEPKGHSPGPLPPMVHEERRPGVALHPEDRDGHARGTAVDGMLYELKMLRFAPGGGLCGALDTPAPLPGGFTAGRDSLLVGRKAQALALSPSAPWVQPWNDLLAGEHLERAAKAGRAWIVLLSPAALENPLSPALPSFGSSHARVVAAQVGQPIVHGGFATAKAGGRGQARENRRCAPPGSAWLLELEGDLADRLGLLRALHMQHSLGDPALRRFGFGWTAVGIAPTPEEERP